MDRQLRNFAVPQENAVFEYGWEFHKYIHILYCRVFDTFVNLSLFLTILLFLFDGDAPFLWPFIYLNVFYFWSSVAYYIQFLVFCPLMFCEVRLEFLFWVLLTFSLSETFSFCFLVLISVWSIFEPSPNSGRGPKWCRKLIDFDYYSRQIPVWSNSRELRGKFDFRLIVEQQAYEADWNLCLLGWFLKRSRALGLFEFSGKSQCIKCSSAGQKANCICPTYRKW